MLKLLNRKTRSKIKKNFFYLRIKSFLNFISPKLGRLYQYPPCEMRLPAHYTKPIKLSNSPRISIVTPAFKQGNFIEQTIRSVLSQGYPNLEYFVQDGGSTDGTVEVIERYSDGIKGWESKPDKGQSHAINLGFAKTSGEIMSWLNADDIILPGTLFYIADFFNRNPDVDVVYGHRIIFDKDNHEVGRWILPSHEDEILSWADFIPQETLFWRRSIWGKIGGYIDESFCFAMDWDLLIRFREAGAHFVRLDRFIGGFRVHSQQKTSSAIFGIGKQEMDKIRHRIFGRQPSLAEKYIGICPYLFRHIVADIGYTIKSKAKWNA